jgi:hypothetical protein
MMVEPEMSQVSEYLYVGSREAARNIQLLQDAGISGIVALGCDAAFPDAFDYCCFPSLMDTPETNIMLAIDETIKFIEGKLSSGKKVLVHCVFGQSRSAAVVVGYFLSKGMMLNEALAHIRSARNSICINPGFLSQLHLIANKIKYHVEFELMTQISLDSECISIPALKCKNCFQVLLFIDDILIQREQADFLEANSDLFWKSYRSYYPKDIMCLNDNRFIFFSKSALIKNHIEQFDDPKKLKRKRDESDALSIRCYNCKRCCGFSKKNGLRICNDYILTDAFVLLSDQVITESMRVTGAPSPNELLIV